MGWRKPEEELFISEDQFNLSRTLSPQDTLRIFHLALQGPLVQAPCTISNPWAAQGTQALKAAWMSIICSRQILPLCQRIPQGYPGRRGANQVWTHLHKSPNQMPQGHRAHLWITSTVHVIVSYRPLKKRMTHSAGRLWPPVAKQQSAGKNTYLWTWPMQPHRLAAARKQFRSSGGEAAKTTVMLFCIC